MLLKTVGDILEAILLLSLCPSDQAHRKVLGKYHELGNTQISRHHPFPATMESQGKVAFGIGTKEVISAQKEDEAHSLRKVRFGEGERKDQEVSQQALHLGLGESGFCPSLN